MHAFFVKALWSRLLRMSVYLDLHLEYVLYI
jgi:hypothetical protein